MRVAAMVLGIIGGVLGLVAALLALTIGGIGKAVEAEGATMIVNLGWASLLFVFLSFVGSGFALARPKLAGWLLLVSGVGFIISISFFAIISGPLFLLASAFAFLGREKRAQVVPMTRSEPGRWDLSA